MTSGAPSRSASIFPWAAVLMTVVLLIAGAILHGVSLDVRQRFWEDIFARFGGQPRHGRWLDYATLGR